ncbi:MAG: Ribosomal RNA small subunit methyltransferase H [Microgenomates bacterium OLB23]|nr:MAG: Ribosomal RNA small subunit methyltransferase H [Microgenomates bacterium OLB23]
MHTSVLLHEAVDSLHVVPNGRYVDATFGVGGHSRLIAEQGAKVLALEWDSHIVKLYADGLRNLGIALVEANYANIAQIAKEKNFVPCDGILFDLGLSMVQIRESGRGFSYEKDEEPLDMRLNNELRVSAADIIASYSKDQLYEIFTKHAEELSAGTIVEYIVRARTLKRIQTVGDLKVAMGEHSNVQTLARIFQALRMEVNNEFRNITLALKGSFEILKTGGRIAVITFHPGEDRLVKRELALIGFKEVHKKPIKGSYKKKFRTFSKVKNCRKINL